MRGLRVPQLLWLTALIAVAAAGWAAVPAVAEPEECGPYTRTQLEADHAETTTTTSVVDPVETVPGRGVEVDEDAGEELLPDPDATQPSDPAERECPEFVYELEYPVVGGGTFGSGFGAPRDGGARLHMGVDLMAPKMTPVVAVADGEVAFVRDDDERCCYLGITHSDGWQSWYIHLNNDSFGTDDGLGVGIRPGLEAGTDVIAGELIGWVGDSGNAETTDPHLHFELHLPSGEPVDAWPSVREAAARPARAVAGHDDPDLEPGTDPASSSNETDPILASTDPRPSFAGPFVDDDASPAEPVFAAMAAQGVTVWCDPWGIRVCPENPALGDDAEEWVAAVTGSDRDPSVAVAYTSPAVDPDLDRSLHCSTSQFCPGEPITLGEVAAMLIGAGDGSSVLSTAEAIDRIAPMIGACEPPADGTLNRLQLAELLARWQSPPDTSCPDVS